MPPEDRKYVRIYYPDLIRDYPDVWADDAALAAFVRLLSTADPMWPTPPELPRSAKARAIDKLKAAGLLIALPMHRFSIKGLDAERSKRSDAARNAAASRWQDKGNAGGNANTMPTRNDYDQTKNEHDTDAHDDEPEWPVLSWMSSVGATLVPNGNGYHRELIALVERQGAVKVIAAMKARAAAGDRSVRQLLYGASNALEPIASGKDAKPKGHHGNAEEAERAFNRGA